MYEKVLKVLSLLAWRKAFFESNFKHSTKNIIRNIRSRKMKISIYSHRQKAKKLTYVPCAKRNQTIKRIPVFLTLILGIINMIFRIEQLLAHLPEEKVFTTLIQTQSYLCSKLYINQMINKVFWVDLSQVHISKEKVFPMSV